MCARSMSEMVEQTDAVGSHVRQRVGHRRDRLALQRCGQDGTGRHALAVELARQADVAVVELDDEQPLRHELIDVPALPRDQLARVAVDDQQRRVVRITGGDVFEFDPGREHGAWHRPECCRAIRRRDKRSVSLRCRRGIDTTGACAGPGEPDRRSHRLHRWSRVPDGDRSGHHDRVRHRRLDDRTPLRRRRCSDPHRPPRRGRPVHGHATMGNLRRGDGAANSARRRASTGPSRQRFQPGPGCRRAPHSSARSGWRSASTAPPSSWPSRPNAPSTPPPASRRGSWISCASPRPTTRHGDDDRLPHARGDPCRGSRRRGRRGAFRRPPDTRRVGLRRPCGGVPGGRGGARAVALEQPRRDRGGRPRRPRAPAGTSCRHREPACRRVRGRVGRRRLHHGRRDS